MQLWHRKAGWGEALGSWGVRVKVRGPKLPQMLPNSKGQHKGAAQMGLPHPWDEGGFEGRPRQVSCLMACGPRPGQDMPGLDANSHGHGDLLVPGMNEGLQLIDLAVLGLAYPDK